MKYFIVMCLGFVVLVPTTLADNSTIKKLGQTVSKSTLHQEPTYNSLVVVELEKDEAVSIFERHRAWYRISTEHKNGWLKMINIRFSHMAKREDDLGFQRVFDTVVNKQVRPTSSTGVRGFNEEDLKKAKANSAELASLSQYQVTQEQAKAFAQQAKLVVQPSVNLNLREK